MTLTCCDGDMGGMMTGMWMMGLLWLVLIAGLVAVVGLAIFRAFGPRHREQTSVDGPLRTLRERFARGEIDEPEYRERLSVLSGRQDSSVPSEPG